MFEVCDLYIVKCQGHSYREISIITISRGSGHYDLVYDINLGK